MPINLSGSANRAASTVFGSGIIKALRNQNKINEQLTEANTTAQERLQIAMNQKRDTEYQVANVKNQDAINLSKRKQHLMDIAAASYMDAQPPIDPNSPSVNFNIEDENGNKSENYTVSPAEMADMNKVNKNDLSEAMDFGSNLAWRLSHKIYGDSPITSAMSRISYEDLAKSGLLYDYAQYSKSFTYDDLDDFVDYVLGKDYKDAYNLTAADYDGDYDNTKFMDKSRYDFIHKLRNDFKNKGGDK